MNNVQITNRSAYFSQRPIIDKDIMQEDILFEDLTASQERKIFKEPPPQQSIHEQNCSNNNSLMYRQSNLNLSANTSQLNLNLSNINGTNTNGFYNHSNTLQAQQLRITPKNSRFNNNNNFKQIYDNLINDNDIAKNTPNTMRRKVSDLSYLAASKIKPNKNPQLMSTQILNQLNENQDLQISEQTQSHKAILKILALVHVQKFINFLRSNIVPHTMNTENIQKIGDLAFIQSKEKSKNKVILKIKSYIKKFKQLPVLLPESVFIMIWEIITVCMIIVQLVFIPMKVAFELKFSKNSFNYQFFGIFAALLFIFDIFFKFNTAFYYRGQLITDRIKVITHYLTTSFLLDLLPVLSIITVMMYRQEYLEYGLFTRILQIGPRVSKLNQYFQIKQNFPFMYELLSLIFLVILVAHLSGCGFYQIGRYEDFYDRHSWIVEFNVKDQDFIEKYITSLYFTFISMITVGYGDILPISVNEKAYVIIMTIFTCGIFGFAVNKMGMIFNTLIQKQKEKESEQVIMQQFCNQRQITHQTQYKILRSLEFQKNIKFGKDKEAQELLQKVDSKLQLEFKAEYFGKLLLQQKTLRFNFTEATLNALAQIMEERIIKKGEILFKENETVQEMSILLAGEVQLYKQKLNKTNTYGQIHKNMLLGLKGFLGGTYYESSGLCLTEARIAFIRRVDFMNIIKKNDQDYQKFCELKDMININQVYIISADVCLSCKYPTHTMVNCPALNGRFNKWLINQKYERRSQQRQSIQIVNQKYTDTKIVPRNRFQTLLQNVKVRQDLKEFRLEVIEILYGYELLGEEEEYLNDQTYKSDKHYLKSLPIIKKNKVDPDKVQKIIGLQDCLYDLEQQSDISENGDNQYGILNDELNELQSDISENDEQPSSQSEDEKAMTYHSGRLSNNTNEIQEAIKDKKNFTSNFKNDNIQMANSLNEILEESTNSQIRIKRSTNKPQKSSQLGRRISIEKQYLQGSRRLSLDQDVKKSSIIKKSKNINNTGIISNNNSSNNIGSQLVTGKLSLVIKENNNNNINQNNGNSNNNINVNNNSNQQIGLANIARRGSRRMSFQNQLEPHMHQQRVLANLQQQQQQQQQQLQSQNASDINSQLQNKNTIDTWLQTQYYFDVQKDFGYYKTYNNLSEILVKINEKRLVILQMMKQVQKFVTSNQSPFKKLQKPQIVNGKRILKNSQYFDFNKYGTLQQQSPYSAQSGKNDLRKIIQNKQQSIIYQMNHNNPNNFKSVLQSNMLDQEDEVQEYKIK